MAWWYVNYDGVRRQSTDDYVNCFGIITGEGGPGPESQEQDPVGGLSRSSQYAIRHCDPDHAGGSGRAALAPRMRMRMRCRCRCRCGCSSAMAMRSRRQWQLHHGDFMRGRPPRLLRRSRPARRQARLPRRARAVAPLRLPSRWGCCHPHPSQTRTCRFPASGSSRESFARVGVKAVDDPRRGKRMALERL